MGFPVRNGFIWPVNVADEDESTVIDEPKKMLIIDCRSYGAAFANRAKGGGVECPGMLSTIGASFSSCL